MAESIAVVISPNWGDYAEKYLKECLESVRRQNYQGRIKVFITDNESSPKSAVFLRKIAPEAEITFNRNNDGFAKGVNDSMKKALRQGFPFIAVFNIHVRLDDNCLSEMVKAFKSRPLIGAVQARQMMPDESTINSLGNSTHFLGFGYCSGYREKWRKQMSKINDIHYPSGSSMLFSREIISRIGLFDEEYWMYNEDQEIGWRLRLAGYRCVAAREAVIFNDYKFKRSIRKYYWMDRNRILAILECYHFLTLVLVFPAFTVMEAGLFLFAWKGGWLKDKLSVWKYFLRPGNWRYILKARRRNQNLRRTKEKEIVRFITGRIWYQEINDWKLNIINPVFNLYWRVASKLIFW